MPHSKLTRHQRGHRPMARQRDHAGSQGHWHQLGNRPRAAGLRGYSAPSRRLDACEWLSASMDQRWGCWCLAAKALRRDITIQRRQSRRWVRTKAALGKACAKSVHRRQGRAITGARARVASAFTTPATRLCSV